eukprot:6192479-Pleurochrysis_carterae.AAC.6
MAERGQGARRVVMEGCLRGRGHRGVGCRDARPLAQRAGTAKWPRGVLQQTLHTSRAGLRLRRRDGAKCAQTV